MSTWNFDVASSRAVLSLETVLIERGRAIDGVAWSTHDMHPIQVCDVFHKAETIDI